jgi:hypothetical protein
MVVMCYLNKKFVVIMLVMCLGLTFVFPAFAEGGASSKPDQVVVVGAYVGNGQATIYFLENQTGETPDVYQIHWWNNTSNEEDADYLTPVEMASAQLTDGLNSHTFTGMTNGKTYYFKIYAVKGADGYSERSAIVDATPLNVTKVSGVKAVAGDGKITVTFDRNKTGDAPEGYEVHWWNNSAKESEAKYMKPVEIPSSKMTGLTYSYTFTGLTNGKTYYFKVYPVKGDKAGFEKSVIISAKPAAVSKPTTPSKPQKPANKGKSNKAPAQNTKPKK